MAIAYKSQGAGTSQNGTTALAPVCPATVDAGDILAMQVVYRGTSQSPETPEGWTLLNGPNDVGTTVAAQQWVLGKIAVGNEDGAAVSLGTTTAIEKVGRIYSFSGRVSGSITELVTGFASIAHGTDPQMPKLEALMPDAKMVAFITQSDNNALAAATGETGGDWIEAVAEFVAELTTGFVIQIQTATHTGAPKVGSMAGGAVAATNDPSGTTGFVVLPEPLPTAPAEAPKVRGNTTNSTTGTTLTGTKVTGTVKDDTQIAIAAAFTSGGATLITPPAGWDEVPGTHVKILTGAGADSAEIRVFERVTGESDPGSWNWTVASGGACITLITLEGTCDVADVSTVSSGSSDVTELSIPTVSYTSSKALVLFAASTTNGEANPLWEYSKGLPIVNVASGTTATQNQLGVGSLWPISGTETGTVTATNRNLNALGAENSAAVGLVISPVGGKTVEGAVSLSGTGSLAGAGTRKRLGAVTLSGVGLSTALGIRVATSSSLLTGTGSLTVGGIRVATSSSLLTGTGSLLAGGIRVVSSSALLTGTGLLIADGIVESGIDIVEGAVLLSGTGTLLGAGTRLRNGAAPLSGLGSISVSGVRLASGTVLLSGTGTLIATGIRAKKGAVLLSGIGSLSASGIRARTGAVQLVGLGTLTSVSKRIRRGSVILTGSGTVLSSGIVQKPLGAGVYIFISEEWQLVQLQ